jgi:hypothetical protein
MVVDFLSMSSANFAIPDFFWKAPNRLESRVPRVPSLGTRETTNPNQPLRVPEGSGLFIPGQTPSAIPRKIPPSQNENHPQTVPPQKPTLRALSTVDERFRRIARLGKASALV